MASMKISGVKLIGAGGENHQRNGGWGRKQQWRNESVGG
jgi:hypothetical protein